MREETHRLALIHFLRYAALALVLVGAPIARSSTIWTGPVTNYTQVNPSDEDQLTANVALTRGSTMGLYNAVTETGYTHDFSPADTEWSYGTIDEYTNLTYTNWEQWNGGSGNVLSMLNQQAVLHLITDDIYLSIEFTAWGSMGVGGFAYTRSTPAAVAPPTPTVYLTNPADGAVFAAPANVTLEAGASVSGGSVTNVTFFGNGVSLGFADAAPFSVTASNLGAGSYALTAVATAAGVSATSSVVNITVVSQVIVSPPNYTVTTPGNEFEYVVNGASSGLTASNANVDDSLNFTLNAGAAYIFSMSTGSTHPVDICTNTNTSSFYTGASAQAVHAGTVTLTIPATNYPTTLYYICNVHTFYGIINVAPPQPPPPATILQTSVTTNIILTFSGGTNTIQLIPQFSSNLASGLWQPVPSFTNTFSGNSTNTTSFDRLDAICGPDVFLRISQAPN
jgi:hypothetical protein